MIHHRTGDTLVSHKDDLMTRLECEACMRLIMARLRPYIEDEWVRLFRLALPFEAGMVQSLIEADRQKYQAVEEEDE